MLQVTRHQRSLALMLSFALAAFAMAGVSGGQTAQAGVATTSSFGDEYETDDSYGQATPIAVDGTSQSHTIHVLADEDWVRFDAVAGAKYVIWTYLGDPEFETAIEAYQADGTTLILRADMNGYDATFSTMQVTATATGPMYARITSAAGDRCGEIGPEG